MALEKIIVFLCVLVIKTEAQFHNDANTQVGSQSATSGSNYFINEPGGKLQFLKNYSIKFIQITLVCQKEV